MHPNHRRVDEVPNFTNRSWSRFAKLRKRKLIELLAKGWAAWPIVGRIKMQRTKSRKSSMWRSTWALTGADNSPGYDLRDAKMVSDNATLVNEFYAAFPSSKALIDRLLSF